VLTPDTDSVVLAEILALDAAGATENPRPMELRIERHYIHHVPRLAPADWPEPVSHMFKRLSADVYVRLQEPSELGASAGTSRLGPHGRSGADRGADVGHRSPL
jgi:proline iminopeptidase